MPDMNINDNKYVLQLNTTEAGTVTKTLHTTNTFVDKEIEIDVTTPAGAQTITGGTLTPGNGSTSIASNGFYDGSNLDSTKYVNITETRAKDYYELESNGMGSVNMAAVNKQVGTAGFFDQDRYPVVAIPASSESSDRATRKYYIKQSTISTNAVTPQTIPQTITISDGYHHQERSVTVNAMDTTYVTEGTTTVDNGEVTRGSATWGTGWITSNSIDPATFANSGTTGQNYVDISETSAAPVLTSGDYLYINKGYTDNLKISLAKLVPNAADVKGHAEYILSGHRAYDEDGALVAGSIPTYDYSYTVT